MPTGFYYDCGHSERNQSLLELSDYAENVLQQQIQTVDEVSAINIFGQKSYAMRIWLNPDKMSAYNVAFSDIRTALNSENIELPPGKYMVTTPI